MPSDRSEALRRYHAKRRYRETLLPTHVRRWMREKAVAPALQPFVAERSGQFVEMLEALGGADHVSPQERAMLDAWFAAQVTADAIFALILKDEDHRLVERHAAYLSAARAALQAVGLERRAREVETLADYIEVRSREASETPQEGASAPNGSAPDDSQPPATAGTEEI